jgi:hypothetical protein
MFKRNIAVIACFLVVASIYGFLKLHKQEGEVRQDETSRLFTGGIDDIKAFTLTNEHGTLRAEMQDEEWYIKSPVSCKTDADTVLVMLSNLAGTKKKHFFEADDLTQYGLKKPKARVSLEFNQPEKNIVVFFGNLSTMPGRYFAMVEGEKDVFTVSANARMNMMKSLYDIRDKRVMPLSIDEVTSFTLKNGSGFIAAQRKDKKTWNLKSPVEYPGERKVIEDLIRDVNAAQVTEFVTPSTATLAAYGLDNPMVVLTLIEKQGEEGVEKRWTLSMGSRKDEFNYYAIVEGDDSVIVVNSELFMSLNVSYQKLRTQNLFTTTLVNVDEVTMQRAGETLSLGRNADRYWIFKDSDNKCDHSRVVAMLSRVVSAKVIEFVDDNPESLEQYGLDKPAIDISIKDVDQDITEGLLLGTVADKRGVYAMKQEGKSVVIISLAVFNAVNVKPDHFIDTRILSDLNPDNIAGIIVKERYREFRLRKKATSWELGRVPVTTKDAIQYTPIELSVIDGLLDEILDIRYDFSMREWNNKIPDTEFKRPRIIFTLTDKNGDKIVDLIVGSKNDAWYHLAANDKAYMVLLCDIQDIEEEWKTIVD